MKIEAVVQHMAHDTNESFWQSIKKPGRREHLN